MKLRLKAAYYALLGHGVIIGVEVDSEDPIHENLILGAKHPGKKLLIADNRPMRIYYWSRRDYATQVHTWRPKGDK